MGALDIRWPSGPYRRGDERQRRWIRIAGWGLILVALAMIASHGRDRRLPQDLADFAISIGMGRTLAGAVVESWNCGPYERDTFWERSRRGIRHECLIRIRGAIAHDYEFRTGYSAAYDPGRVATIAGRIGVAWPAWVMVERLTNLGVTLVIGLLTILGGAFMVRTVREADRFAAPEARIIDVDLLCRKMMQRGALWDFAYDASGRRVLAQAMVHEDPVITDGVVTCGAAILAPSGAVQLMTVSTVRLPAEVQNAITASFHAARAPLDPGFDSFLAGTREGPERNYASAFRRAWHAPDVEQVNAAILDRHEAALALDPARVDALLRQCRHFA